MEKRYYRMLICLYLSILSYGTAAAKETVLKAAIVGRKGTVNVNEYNAIASILMKDNEPYCRIEFTALEYDTSNGTTVYESLKEARATFEDQSIAVAIGPQIDVFTSTDYVILNQIHFVTSSDEFIEPANRTMPILPAPKALSKAITLIVKAFKWHKVAFLSQDDFSPVLSLGGEGIFVSPIRLPSEISSSDNPQLLQTLTTLRESQMDKFILHSMNKDVVKIVIQAAQRLHLLHHSISWFITYLDFGDIIHDIREMTEIYGMQLFNNETGKLPKAVNDMFNGTLSRLQQGLLSDVVGILYHYLDMHVDGCDIEPVNDSNMTARDFQDVLQKNTGKPYSGALGNYYWPKDSQSGKTNVRNEYMIPVHRYDGKDGRIGVVYFDRKDTEYRSSRIFEVRPIDGMRSVDGAFKNKTFTIIAKQDEPFVMKTPAGEYVGFCVDVLIELSRRLNNFQFNIFELSEDQTGQNGKTRVWDEIIAQLKNGNASIAVGAFAVTADREAKISFSYTIISSSVSLLLKRPPETVNFFQFLWPFSTMLWIMIMVFFLVVGLGLYFMSRFDSTQDGSEQKFDLKESMWYSLTVLLQGSTEFSPQTTSMRTIVAFFWFCTLVINAAYTANLAAFLTLQQVDNRMKSVDMLARQTLVKYGVLNNSDLMHFFERSRDAPYERMWAFMKLNEKQALVPDRKKGLKQVLEENFAYLDDGVINNYISQRNCEVESIEQSFGIKHFSLGFPKGAPYRGDINRELLRLKEDGTLDRLRSKWWDSKSNCPHQTARSSTQVNTASELDISNMFGVFIVLIAFTILAILYEIGSSIWKVVRKRQKKKTEKAEDEKPPGNNIQFGVTKPSTTAVDEG